MYCFNADISQPITKGIVEQQELCGKATRNFNVHNVIPNTHVTLLTLPYLLSSIGT